MPDINEQQKTPQVTFKTLTPLLPLLIISSALFLCGITAFLIYQSMDFTKPRMERLISDTLGTEVKFGHLEIFPMPDEPDMIELRDLHIHNVAGFDSPSLLTAGTVTIKAEQVTENRFIFHEIIVSDLKLYLDITGETTNLTTLARLSDSRADVTRHRRIGKIPARVAIKALRFDDIDIQAQNQNLDQNLTLPGNIWEDIGGIRGQLVSPVIIAIYSRMIKEALLATARQGMFDNISAAGAEEINRAIGTHPTEADIIDQQVRRTLRALWHLRGAGQ